MESEVEDDNDDDDDNEAFSDGFVSVDGDQKDENGNDEISALSNKDTDLIGFGEVRINYETS